MLAFCDTRGKCSVLRKEEEEEEEEEEEQEENERGSSNISSEQCTETVLSYAALIYSSMQSGLTLSTVETQEQQSHRSSVVAILQLTLQLKNLCVHLTKNPALRAPTIPKQASCRHK